MEDLKLYISGHLNNYEPFALRSPRGNIAVFIARQLTVVWLNVKYVGPTVNKCKNQQEFLAAIGLTVLGHRELIEVPKKALEYINRLDNGLPDTTKFLS